LALEANLTKLDTARYTYERHLQFVNLWTGKLLFNGNKSLSTADLGQLANQAQHRARGVIRALRESAKETGNKVNVPVLQRVGCPARIEASQNSFDYWLTIENEFEKAKRVALPVKSHGKLNRALKQGWALNPVAEFFKDRNGRFYARVFVQKEVKRAEPKPTSLGVDVGINHCVARSDGYLGRSAGKILRKARARDAERRRQGHQRSLPKSSFRQQLDIEAKRAVNVSLNRRQNLVVESPKILANLKPSLQWARVYFANRCHILGREKEVFTWNVNPWNTSRTCYKCGYVAAESRNGVSFTCVGCGYKTHSDIGAARNIGRKGTESIMKMRSGSGKRSVRVPK
jgi:transposase